MQKLKYLHNVVSRGSKKTFEETVYYVEVCNTLHTLLYHRFFDFRGGGGEKFTNSLKFCHDLEILRKTSHLFTKVNHLLNYVKDNEEKYL